MRGRHSPSEAGPGVVVPAELQADQSSTCGGKEGVVPRRFQRALDEGERPSR